MSPGQRRARVWVGWLLAAAFLAALLWSTLAQSGAECEACVAYRGETACSTVAAADTEIASEQAVASACAVLSRGVTQGLECQRTPASSLRCDAP